MTKLEDLQKTLEQNSKDYGEIGKWIWQVEKTNHEDFLKRLHTSKWVSVEDVTAFLAQVFSQEKVILVSRKQLEERLEKLEKFTTQEASGKRQIIKEILRDGF